MKNITYVQEQVSMELNKDIVDIANRYKGYEKLDTGLKVRFERATPTQVFKAKNLSDLNTFYDSNAESSNETEDVSDY